jgi:hypothetical protein
MDKRLNLLMVTTLDEEIVQRARGILENLSRSSNGHRVRAVLPNEHILAAVRGPLHCTGRPGDNVTSWTHAIRWVSGLTGLPRTKK